MKKFLLLALSVLIAPLTLSGCKKSVNYFDYVSDNRKGVYLYSDDLYEIKIYVSNRETPYLKDGVKGIMTTLTEVFYTPKNSPTEVVLQLGEHGGEMNYMAVERCFYLSFSGEIDNKESVLIKLSVDGKEFETEVKNVLEKGTIAPEVAVKCVSEYDKTTFERLTSSNRFSGEISVRLLYDGGCYYYVGVCDRDKNVKAYLVSGADGRIIAERESCA